MSSKKNLSYYEIGIAKGMKICGSTNAEIADKLNVSIRTIQRLNANDFSKN